MFDNLKTGITNKNPNLMKRKNWSPNISCVVLLKTDLFVDQ